MSRGRKPKSKNDVLNWEQFFNKNVGSYLQIIGVELCSKKNLQAENALDLLKKIRVEKIYLIKEKKLKKGNELSPIKKEDIPYEIPANWVWCRLGEIGICKTGTTPSTQVKKYFGNDIPFIKPADITLRGLVIDNEGLSYEGLKQGVLIPANSLMMVCIGGSIGKSYYSNIDVSCNQQINTITPLAGIRAQFLQYLLRSEYFQKAIWEKASGGTTPIINRNKWESIPIPLPPLTEQNSIIDFFEDFENNSLKEEGYYFNKEVEQKVIDLHSSQLKGSQISHELTHQLSLVKKLRQQLLQDAVQGKLVVAPSTLERAGGEVDEPASELLKKIKAEKEQLILKGKIKQGKLQEAEQQNDLHFEIPKNWAWCSLDEISKNITDGTHQTPIYTKSGRVFLSAQNIKPFKFMPEKHKLVSDETYKEIIRNRKPEKGDILVARVGAGIGEAAVIDQDVDFCFYVSLGLIQPFKDYLNTDYITLVINSPYGVKYAKGNISSKGGSAGNFNLGRIRSLLIPLPPLLEQNHIMQKFEEVMQNCNALEESIKQSALQNEKLLQQVLREALRGVPFEAKK